MKIMGADDEDDRVALQSHPINAIKRRGKESPIAQSGHTKKIDFLILDNEKILKLNSVSQEVKTAIKRVVSRKAKRKKAEELAAQEKKASKSTKSNRLTINISTTGIIEIHGRPPFTSQARAIKLSAGEDRRHVIGYDNELKPSCQAILGKAYKHFIDDQATLKSELAKHYKNHNLKRPPKVDAPFENHVKYIVTQLNSVVNNLNPGSAIDNQGAECFRGIVIRLKERIAKETNLQAIEQILKENLKPSSGTTARIDLINANKKLLEDMLLGIKKDAGLDDVKATCDVIELLDDCIHSAGTDLSPDGPNPKQTAFALEFTYVMKKEREDPSYTNDSLPSLFGFFAMPSFK